MPADLDKGFYEMLDSIAETDDAVQQNKKIKEAQFAEDSREPNEEEIEAIRKELKEEKEDQGRRQMARSAQGEAQTSNT